MVAAGQDSEAALDFRYWLNLFHFEFFICQNNFHALEILKGRSCRSVARRGESFTTLETLIAYKPWWSWWTGAWCCICICCICIHCICISCVFIFSFPRRDQKWHVWNGALPTKTSLQSALDPLIFFTPTCQVSLIGKMMSTYMHIAEKILIWAMDILLSTRWSGFLHSEEPQLAWNEPQTAVVAFLHRRSGHIAQIALLIDCH